MSRRLAAYLPAVIWAAFVLWVGGRETLPAPPVTFPMIDKVAHFVVYGLLGVLTAWGWRRAGGWPARGWPVAAALALGAYDELRQRALPGRSAELGDWVADAAGFTLAFLWLTAIWHTHSTGKGSRG